MSLDGLHLRARPRRVDMRTQEAGVDSTPGARRSDKGVGAALQRKEDKRHLFGRGQFTCDLRFPNLHDVAFLRSPIAHGRSEEHTSELKSLMRISYAVCSLQKKKKAI